jgi:hypothetical protein
MQLPTPRAALDVERLDEERLGQGELTLVHVKERQVVHGHLLRRVLFPILAAVSLHDLEA